MKMLKRNYTRREFVKQNSLTGLGAILGMSFTPSVFAHNTRDASTLAILGGKPVRDRAKKWPGWPVWNPDTDEEQVIKVLRSGIWSRRDVVTEFETKWAEINGAKRCLTTVNGTNAMICALRNLDVGGGDEVIVPPYTFMATIQAVLQTGAMPVFVDVDPENGLIDVNKIEEKITPRTKAILPVHILGFPADMVRLMEIAKKHNLVVVEDACNAWLAEINHKKMGTFGDAGCFSFQNSKHCPMGEGGAILSDDDEFMDKCFSYHNWGTVYGSVTGILGQAVREGTKMRLTEYQAAIGLAQLKRLESTTRTRSENAEYVKSKIKNIPGFIPFKIYDNVTRTVYHAFPFRYIKEEFKGLPRADFMKALSAEGISCGVGWGAWLHKGEYLNQAFQSKNFQKMYPKRMLDFNRYLKQNECPKIEWLVDEEAVWFGHTQLLGTRSDMNDIATAIEKVYLNAEKLI
ncbi:DegT/DnrJ/EryC1/StrS family aminotransferase [Bacteroidota bacterium]